MKRVLRAGKMSREQIGEYESWFQDMAAKGLHLSKLGSSYAHFEKGEPKQTKYRVLSSQITMEQKDTDEYTGQGWDFVTKYIETWDFYLSVYSSPVEANAPEPCADTNTIRKFIKHRYIRQIILYCIFLIAAPLLIIAVYRKEPYFLGFVDWEYFTILVSFILLPFLSLGLILETFRISRRLIKTFAPDWQINHTAPWKKRHVPYAAGYTFVLAFMLCIFLIPAIKLLTANEKNLPAGYSDLPIVRLAAIEKNKNYTRVPASISKGIDQNNYYMYDSRYFAPVKINTFENGYSYEYYVMYNKGAPYIETEVYKLRFASMRNYILSDLMKEKTDKDDKTKASEVSNPKFDKLFVDASGGFVVIYALKGNSIMYVLYRGDANADTVIAAVADKILS